MGADTVIPAEAGILPRRCARGADDCRILASTKWSGTHARLRRRAEHELNGSGSGFRGAACAQGATPEETMARGDFVKFIQPKVTNHLCQSCGQNDWNLVEEANGEEPFILARPLAG